MELRNILEITYPEYRKIPHNIYYQVRESYLPFLGIVKSGALIELILKNDSFRALDVYFKDQFFLIGHQEKNSVSLLGTVQSYNGKSAEECKIQFISEKQVKQLLGVSSLAEELLRLQDAKISELERKLTDSKLPIIERLTIELIKLAKKKDDIIELPDGTYYTLELTHKQLGYLIGCARENITIALSKLKNNTEEKKYIMGLRMKPAHCSGIRTRFLIPKTEVERLLELY